MSCPRLGAVWTAVHMDVERISTVRNILNIPENIIPLNVIPIGIPKETGQGFRQIQGGKYSLGTVVIQGDACSFDSPTHLDLGTRNALRVLFTSSL